MWGALIRNNTLLIGHGQTNPQFSRILIKERSSRVDIDLSRRGRDLWVIFGFLDESCYNG